MKNQSIGKYSLMIVENFDMLCCESGAWMPDYEREKNSLLKISSLLLTYIRIPASYIVSNSHFQTTTQLNAEVDETQNSCGEVQQITHKGIIQLTLRW